MSTGNSNIQTKRTAYKHRIIARIILETETPIKIGSGQSDLLTDSLILRDVNGLPYIPGTAITGVIRHAIEKVEAHKESVSNVFGCSHIEGNEVDKENEEEKVKKDDKEGGVGSRFICSSAHLVAWDEQKTVLEGILDTNKMEDDIKKFCELFNALPLRQHVRISEKGVAANTGKFDEEVVYKGARFCFEMELFGDKEEEITFFESAILPQLYSISFRLGGGTRKGFGSLKVLSCKVHTYHFEGDKKAEDLKAYLEKSASLNAPFESNLTPEAYKDLKKNLEGKGEELDKGWVQYTLSLKPNDFMLFGSGLSDDEADMTPVIEKWIDYTNKKLSDYCALIPASSVKGALAHRVAYYYNYITSSKDTGKENKAVQALFGSEKDENGKSSRGHVLFSDIYRKSPLCPVFNHVAIDRFTGGAIEGFLFNEKVVYGNNQVFTLKISVEASALEKKEIRTAWESALEDLCNGLLPLGGNTNRGHGSFTGTMTIKEGKEEKQ